MNNTNILSKIFFYLPITDKFKIAILNKKMWNIHLSEIEKYDHTYKNSLITLFDIELDRGMTKEQINNHLAIIIKIIDSYDNNS